MLRRIEEGREALEAKIEEVQRANAQIASAQASLVRSEKLASVGHLAAGVAHEVGNPLAAVSGYVELLEGAELDEDEREDVLRRTTIQVERIRTIIRNLLDYSRADNEVERIATPLRPVAEDAVALVEAIPRARHRTFDIQGEATAATFAGHVVQVLVNLLVNAVDAYGEADGNVEIMLNEFDGRATIVVEDHGPGISPDELERVFEPFYTTKDVGEGTGLGLSICQRLIEDLGGSLRVESEVGVGTRFEVELPGCDHG
jgi:signal transduction histidine kinase